MDYQLTLNAPGRPPAVRTITGDTPADLAQEIHRHARGWLGHQVNVELDGDALTGTLLRGRQHLGAVVLEPAPGPPSPRGAQNLRHGYTLADLDRIARAACAADRSFAADMCTRYDIAWSAAALALAEATAPPSRQHLVRVGWQAIYAEVREVRRLYGIPRDRTVDGVASAPRFAIYWQPTSGTATEDVVVERIAVRQILKTLTPTYRNAVVALAVHNTSQAAAQAVGISETAMRGRLRTAKRLFAERWFAPDSAPRLRRDRRVGAYDRALATHCSAGHEWTAETTRWGRGRAGQREASPYLGPADRPRAATAPADSSP